MNDAASRPEAVPLGPLSFYLRRNNTLVYGAVTPEGFFGRVVPQDDFVETFEELGTLKGLAEKYALTPKMAKTILKAYGISLDTVLARDWNSGMSLEQMSARHGAQPETISKWLKAAGVEIQPGNHKRGVDLDRLKQLSGKGGTYNRAARELGIHWQTVKRLRER